MDRGENILANVININTDFFNVFNSLVTNNSTTIPTSDGVSEEFKNNLEEHTADEEFIKNEKQCSICLDEFKLGDKYIILPCTRGESEENHVFHSGDETCSGIKPWLDRNNTCPMCRKEFPTDNQSILSDQGRTRDIFQNITFHSMIPPDINIPMDDNIENNIPNPNNLENTISNIITNYINEIEANNEQREMQLAIEASLLINSEEDISNN